MRVEPLPEPIDRGASWVTSAARLAAKGGIATVISLEGLRKALGERWPREREAATARLEQLLQQHLGPSDDVVALDDMNRLLIVANAAEAELICLRIVYELNQSVAGCCRLDQLTLSPARAVGDQIIEIDVLPPAALTALVARAGLTLSPDPDREAAIPEASLTVVYQPVWDAELQVIRGYRCRPGDSFRLPMPEDSPERLRALTGATITLMHQAAQHMHRRLLREEPLIISLPVSSRILSSSTARLAFLSGCQLVDPALRPYLTLVVKDLPSGIPQSRVAELDTILSPFCAAVLAHVAQPIAASLPNFRTTGIKALGISLKGLSLAAAETEIALLVAETRRSGIVAFAEHVNDVGQLRLCLERGVRWLLGRAIGPAAAEPGPLIHLPRAALLNGPDAA